jgi:hypothetical protein
VTARTHRAKVTVLRQAISAVTVLLAAILLATGDLRLDLPDRVQQGPPSPWEVTSEAWVAAVGGDQQLTEDSYTQLEAVTDPALGPQATAQVRRVAGDLAVATLTGAGQEQFPGYWPPKPATGAKPAPRCSKVTVRAVAPIVLPTAGNAAGVTRYAKALVLYTGTCGQAKYTVASPGSEYLYLAQTEQGWVPVRPWDIPSARGGADVGAAGGEPAPWELAQFGPCAADHQVLRARILVVSAFEQMCADAASEGVTLTLRSAYLTRAEQAARFAQAVAQYGSEAEARKWVAYADEEVCTSRHCTGLAVNLTPTSAAMTWLEKVVGCHDGHSVTPATWSSRCRARPAPGRPPRPTATRPGNRSRRWSPRSSAAGWARKVSSAPSRTRWSPRPWWCPGASRAGTPPPPRSVAGTPPSPTPPTGGGTPMPGCSC